jgi:hypothetical protein
MSWSLLSWLFAAAIACWCGLLSILHVRVLGAGATARSISQSQQALLRRLTSCEELQNECALAISRMEARDKMRRVRAGRTSETNTADSASASDAGQQTAPPDSPTKLSKLSSAEIRRKLALREPLS